LIAILIAINSVVDTGLFFYPLLVSIVVAGAVMSARMYLVAHTMREVVVGAVAGFATAILGFIIAF
jgi:membrane-associated phospholipid phosphatase